MKQVELTTKLVLAIIGLTSVGAILVPTYAVPTIRSADIFDETIVSADLRDGAAVKSSDIVNGEVTTDDIKDATIQARDIAAGVIPSGAIQVTKVEGSMEVVQGGETGGAEADCPPGKVVIGGGFQVAGNTVVKLSEPRDADTWRILASNLDAPGNSVTISAIAMCV